MISVHFQHQVVLFLSRFPFLQRSLSIIYRKFFRKYVERQRIKRFHNNALATILDFHNCLESNGHRYTLAFGSLLGAIREKGFIKHDVDVDVYMWATDFSPKVHYDLLLAGFKLAHGFTVDDGKSGLELTYEKDGVGIDIFFIYDLVYEYPYCCDFITPDDCQNFEIAVKKHGGVIVRRLEMPFIHERHLTKFENIELYVPDNAEELLEFRYGADYMIPNPNWGIRSFDKHIKIWKGKLGKMISDYDEYI